MPHEENRMDQRQARRQERRKHLANLEHRLIGSEHGLVLLSRDPQGTVRLVQLSHHSPRRSKRS